MNSLFRIKTGAKLGIVCICLCVLLIGFGSVDFSGDNRLKRRIAELEMMLESARNRQCSSPLDNRKIPETRKLGREINMEEVRNEMEEQVTILMFSYKETKNCLIGRIQNVRTEYPKVKLIVASAFETEELARQEISEHIPGIAKEGAALAAMIGKVDTPYFFYLSSSVQLPPQESDISASWLLHALENIPELDFIGGSYLRVEPNVRYPVLELPCFRLRMCNWTLSQTFEYLYSVDDMMVCQETSSSFMGRLSSISKVGDFDSNLETMATTDFFLRAKDKAVVGLRPEVQLIVTRECYPSKLTNVEEADSKLAFMKKYQLFIIRDNFKREVKATDSSDYSSLSNYNIEVNHGGTYSNPMYIRGLLLNLEISADFLEAHNISYFLDSGIPLGGIKMGGILPWDIDIDLGFFGDWKFVHEGLIKLCKDRQLEQNFQINAISGDLREIQMRAAGEFGYNCLYQQPNDGEENKMMYVYVHGRKYPVKTYLFSSFRTHYGVNYLEMHAHRSGRFSCQVPGHHACVPEEYGRGGGHWREFYCEL